MYFIYVYFKYVYMYVQLCMCNYFIYVCTIMEVKLINESVMFTIF